MPKPDAQLTSAQRQKMINANITANLQALENAYQWNEESMLISQPPSIPEVLHLKETKLPTKRMISKQHPRVWARKPPHVNIVHKLVADLENEYDLRKATQILSELERLHVLQPPIVSRSKEHLELAKAYFDKRDKAAGQEYREKQYSQIKSEQVDEERQEQDYYAPIEDIGGTTITGRYKPRYSKYRSRPKAGILSRLVTLFKRTPQRLAFISKRTPIRERPNVTIIPKKTSSPSRSTKALIREQVLQSFPRVPREGLAYFKRLAKDPREYNTNNHYPSYFSAEDKLALQSLKAQPDEFVQTVVQAYIDEPDKTFFDYLNKIYTDIYLEDLDELKEEDLVPIARTNLEQIYGRSFAAYVPQIREFVSEYIPVDEELADELDGLNLAEEELDKKAVELVEIPPLTADPLQTPLHIRHQRAAEMIKRKDITRILDPLQARTQELKIAESMGQILTDYTAKQEIMNNLKDFEQKIIDAQNQTDQGGDVANIFSARYINQRMLSDPSVEKLQREYRRERMQIIIKGIADGIYKDVDEQIVQLHNKYAKEYADILSHAGTSAESYNDILAQIKVLTDAYRQKQEQLSQGDPKVVEYLLSLQQEIAEKRRVLETLDVTTNKYGMLAEQIRKLQDKYNQNQTLLNQSSENMQLVKELMILKEQIAEKEKMIRQWNICPLAQQHIAKSTKDHDSLLAALIAQRNDITRTLFDDLNKRYTEKILALQAASTPAPAPAPVPDIEQLVAKAYTYEQDTIAIQKQFEERIDLDKKQYNSTRKQIVQADEANGVDPTITRVKLAKLYREHMEAQMVYRDDADILLDQVQVRYNQWMQEHNQPENPHAKTKAVIQKQLEAQMEANKKQYNSTRKELEQSNRGVDPALARARLAELDEAYIAAQLRYREDANILLDQAQARYDNWVRSNSQLGMKLQEYRQQMQEQDQAYQNQQAELAAEVYIIDPLKTQEDIQQTEDERFYAQMSRTLAYNHELEYSKWHLYQQEVQLRDDQFSKIVHSSPLQRELAEQEYIAWRIRYTKAYALILKDYQQLDSSLHEREAEIDTEKKRFQATIDEHTKKIEEIRKTGDNALKTNQYAYMKKIDDLTAKYNQDKLRLHQEIDKMPTEQIDPATVPQNVIDQQIEEERQLYLRKRAEMIQEARRRGSHQKAVSKELKPATIELKAQLAQFDQAFEDWVKNTDHRAAYVLAQNRQIQAAQRCSAYDPKANQLHNMYENERAELVRESLAKDMDIHIDTNMRVDNANQLHRAWLKAFYQKYHEHRLKYVEAYDKWQLGFKELHDKLLARNRVPFDEPMEGFKPPKPKITIPRSPRKMPRQALRTHEAFTKVQIPRQALRTHEAFTKVQIPRQALRTYETFTKVQIPCGCR